MKVKVKISGGALRAFNKGGCARKAVKKAVTRASSTSARTMTSTAIAVVRESKALKVKAIKKAVKIRKRKGSAINNMTWGVDVTGATINLIDYPTRQTKKGVSAAINRGNRKLYRGAFIATMPNSKGRKKGHRGVFRRMPGAKRLKIFELRASRPLDVLKKKTSIVLVQQAGDAAFRKTFKRNFKQLKRGC